MDDGSVDRFLVSRYQLRRCRGRPEHPFRLTLPDKAGIPWRSAACACRFQIRDGRDLTSPDNWQANADILVDILDADVNGDAHPLLKAVATGTGSQGYIFLIPSGRAPLRMADPRYLDDGADDGHMDSDTLTRKKDLAWGFINRFHGTPLAGVCFVDKLRTASPNVKVYSSDFDYWLLTGGRERSFDRSSWAITVSIGVVTVTAAVTAAVAAVISAAS